MLQDLISEIPRNTTSQNAPTPAATTGITLAEGKQDIVKVGGYDIRTIVYPPSRVVNANQTVNIYVAAGGQGFGHQVPMSAIVEKLREQPDTQVIYDTNPPVHTFDRGPIDHARYKLSNWSPMSKAANIYRNRYSANPQFEAFSRRIVGVTTDTNMPIHAAIFNHRFGSVAAAEALPQGVPMLQQIPDHGKPHRGWLNHRMLEGTNKLDRLIVANSTIEVHVRRRGVPAARIQTLGYPLRQAYKDWANRTKLEARAALEIPEGKRVLIMSAGNARDPGRFVAQVAGLLEHRDAKNLHLIALCAGNAELQSQLQALQTKLATEGKPDIIHTLGTQDGEGMARLLRAADLNAIQPGGGSLADCYGMGVVPIIWAEKSGIEHSNRKHAQQNNLAIMGFVPPSWMGFFRPGGDDAGLFRRAVFETTTAQLTKILENQEPFKNQMLAGAENIAKVAHAIARTHAGFGVEDESLLELNRPTGRTPGTPATLGTNDPDFTPGSALESGTTPQPGQASGSEVPQF